MNSGKSLFRTTSRKMSAAVCNFCLALKKTDRDTHTHTDMIFNVRRRIYRADLLLHTSVCSPDRTTESAELQHDISSEVGHQPSVHHPAVVLQLSLMTDPLPHLTHTLVPLVFRFHHPVCVLCIWRRLKNVTQAYTLSAFWLLFAVTSAPQGCYWENKVWLFKFSKADSDLRTR